MNFGMGSQIASPMNLEASRVLHPVVMAVAVVSGNAWTAWSLSALSMRPTRIAWNLASLGSAVVSAHPVSSQMWSMIIIWWASELVIINIYTHHCGPSFPSWNLSWSSSWSSFTIPSGPIPQKCHIQDPGPWIDQCHRIASRQSSVESSGIWESFVLIFIRGRIGAWSARGGTVQSWQMLLIRTLSSGSMVWHTPTRQSIRHLAVCDLPGAGLVWTRLDWLEFYLRWPRPMHHVLHNRLSSTHFCPSRIHLATKESDVITRRQGWAKTRFQSQRKVWPPWATWIHFYLKTMNIHSLVTVTSAAALAF